MLFVDLAVVVCLMWITVDFPVARNLLTSDTHDNLSYA